MVRAQTSFQHDLLLVPHKLSQRILVFWRDVVMVGMDWGS